MSVVAAAHETPAVQHRLLFRTGLKEKLVHRADDLGLAGAMALAVAITAAMALVAGVVLGNCPAIVFGAVAGMSHRPSPMRDGGSS